MDAAGDLLIADGANGDIRRVTPGSTISHVALASGTVQGGGNAIVTWSSTNVTAVDILLSTDGGGTFVPIAANVPNSGNYAWNVPINLSTTTAEIEVVNHFDTSVFAASSGTFTVVEPTTPIISIFAGTGTYGFSGDGGQAVSANMENPLGAAVDSNGNLFIADQVNNRIREVNASTGVITTVAGNGIRGYTGDGGPAASAELKDPRGWRWTPRATSSLSIPSTM